MLIEINLYFGIFAIFFNLCIFWEAMRTYEICKKATQEDLEAVQPRFADIVEDLGEVGDTFSRAGIIKMPESMCQ